MFRKSPTILVATLCAAALPGLSACGQKGDLVLPPGRVLTRAATTPTPAPVTTQGVDAALPAWPAAPATSVASSPNDSGFNTGSGNATPAPSNNPRLP